MTILLLMFIAHIARAAEAGTAAPDFTLPSFTGDNLRLEEQAGKVLLINFWASWCGPCRQEMPVLDRIHQRYEGAGFAVIGVNIDKNPKKAERIVRELGLSFPLLKDQDQAVSENYEIAGMPYTVLVDRDGDIRFVHTGYKPGDERAYVDKLRELL